jgi:hypothetical protein
MTEPIKTIEEPFANDMLDRKPAAEFLTKYLIGRHRVSKSVPENASFVLNLNAEWGLGKTYFLMEWAKILRAKGHLVVYFDAWANDYASNPFVGFMAEIQKQLTAGLPMDARVQASARKMIKKGKDVIRAVAPALAVSMVKHYTGLDTAKLAETLKESAIDVAGNLKRDLFKESEDIRVATEAFRAALREVASAVEQSEAVALPIFLLIDELDRCRPPYAIELLENVKHIFRVQDVYTVVATDSTQLSHSIRAIYGAGFDSERYLRRFFDHESRLQKPDFGRIAAFMLANRDLARLDAFENPFAQLLGESANSAVLSIIAQALRLTVRDFQRAIDIVDSIRLTYGSKLEILLISFVTMLYVAHGDAYDAYRQSHAGQAVRTKLTGRVSFDVGIPYAHGVGPHGGSGAYSTGQISVIEFCLSYVDALWNEAPQFMGTEANMTLMQIERGFKRQAAVTSSLREYDALVAMAGSFSV